MLNLPKIEDKNVLMSLNHLNYENDFKDFKRLMQDSLDLLRRQNDDGEGKDLHQRQGACQILQYLIDKVDGARETMDRIRESEHER